MTVGRCPECEKEFPLDDLAPECPDCWEFINSGEMRRDWAAIGVGGYENEAESDPWVDDTGPCVEDDYGEDSFP